MLSKPIINLPPIFIRHFLFLLCLFFSSQSFAEEGDTLRVGIKPSEPWVIYDANQAEAQRVPVGFSIDLWNEIANKMGVTTEWVYYDSTKALVDGAEAKAIDVGIAAITLTSGREKQVDFSNSMYETGLQIMVSGKNNESNPLSVLFKELGKLVSWQVLLGLAVMLFITANLRLWADRYSQAYFFTQESYSKGLQESLWWGITMLVTWETPHSRGVSRIIDLSWHFMGLIALSIMTAIVTAALTSQAISGNIQSEKDLPNKRVAAVATDAPRHYLEKIDADVVPVDSLQAGIQLLLEEKVDALVHDGPRLSYLADKMNKQASQKLLMVLPAVFNPQNYGLVFNQDSNLRESVNKNLLYLRETDSLDVSFHESLKQKWIPSN